MKKRFISLLMMTALAFSLSACGNNSEASSASSGSNNNKGTIAICVAQTSNEFQARLMDAMLTYAEDNNINESYNFTVFDAKFDTATQLQQVENAVSQGVDGIIMIAVDMKGSVAAVNVANDAGIPIVGVNTDIEDNSLFTSYVGSDCTVSGFIEMTALAEAMGGEGKIVEMHGNYGEAPQIQRDAGIRQALSEYPDIEIVAEDTATWNRDQGLAVMENWIQSGAMNGVKAVVAQNDAMAVGAMIALEDAGMTDVLVAGIDANEDMLGYLKEGRTTVTVFQNATSQGEQGVAQMLKILNGEDYEQTVWIDYELVTSENVDQYLALYQ